MNADQPRFLHRNPAHGYTANPSRALRGEPEAVSADVQAEITANAQRAARERTLSEWSKTRDRVLGAVQHFETVGRPAPQVRRSLRLVRRAVVAVDRHLGT